MAEKSDNEILILIGTGILIGAAFIFLALHKQAVAQTQASPAPQQQPSYKQDIEFVRWYTETIVKPSIESAARESAQNAIRQFIEENPRAEVQTLGEKAPRTRSKNGAWEITRDSEGAITSIQNIKTIKQDTKEILADKINIRKNNIT